MDFKGLSSPVECKGNYYTINHYTIQPENLAGNIIYTHNAILMYTKLPNLNSVIWDPTTNPAMHQCYVHI